MQQGNLLQLILAFSLFQFTKGFQQAFYGQNIEPSSSPFSYEDDADDTSLFKFFPRHDNSVTDKDGEIFILEDKDYPRSLYEQWPGVGQVSGITVMPSNDVAIFHRADREWTADTFGPDHALSISRQAAQERLIKNDTIMIIDGENGSAITTLGANLFYMPHGIASDNLGNLWLTDVGRHQVMRLPTSRLLLRQQVISKAAAAAGKHNNNRWLPGNLTQIWPDLVLGEAFVPGSDHAHFCKPSEVTVSENGRLIFVADGYCNKRVMVFTNSGKFLASFGEQQNLSLVHSITLIESRNLLCLADRESDRILCFKAALDGDLESLGELVLDIQYPLGRVFALVGLGKNHLLVSSNQHGTSRYDLAALNPFTSEIKRIWTSSDLLAPHSLARTRDQLFAYAADLSRDAYKKVFKFNVIQRLEE